VIISLVVRVHLVASWMMMLLLVATVLLLVQMLLVTHLVQVCESVCTLQVS
jgi:hypothetical protein